LATLTQSIPGVNWHSGKAPNTPLLPDLLKHTASAYHNLIIARAVRALSPWPGVWTIDKNGKRCKILKVHLDTEKKLVVDVAQVEGKLHTTGTCAP